MYSFTYKYGAIKSSEFDAIHSIELQIKGTQGERERERERERETICNFYSLRCGPNKWNTNESKQSQKMSSRYTGEVSSDSVN